MPEVECIHGALMTFPDVPSPTIGSKTTRPNFALNVALDLASPNGATTAVTVDTSSALGAVDMNRKSCSFEFGGRYAFVKIAMLR